MTLSKRVRVLICVLTAAAVLFAVILFLYVPAMEKRAESHARYAELIAEAAEMEELIARQPNVEEQINALEKNLKEEHAQFFDDSGQMKADAYVASICTDFGLSLRSLMLSEKRYSLNLNQEADAENAARETQNYLMGIVEADVEADGTLDELEALVKHVQAQKHIRVKAIGYDASTSQIRVSFLIFTKEGEI